VPGSAGPRGSRAVAAWTCCVLALAGLLAPHAARGQGALSAIETETDQIVRRARPSMVTIIAEREVPPPRPGAAGVPRMRSRVGSGVAVAPDAILTTTSVLLGAKRVHVLTSNGLVADAEIAGIDPVYNVALLRVPGLRLPALAFATRRAELGDWVLVLGSSYGAAPTQSVGTIAFRYGEPRMSLLQLTNDVYPGNSGGAAINSRGELVGLVEGELGSPQAPGQESSGERRPGGMSFAIPSEDILPSYTSLMREGRVHCGFLGVSTRGASVESETQPGTQVALGALVESVQPGGPADRAGLRKGDLIVAFDNERVEYPEQLARWVAAAHPGTQIKLVWAHDEMERSARVTLAESPTVIPEWMEIGVGTLPSTATARGGEPDVPARRTRPDVDRFRGAQDSTH